MGAHSTNAEKFLSIYNALELHMKKSLHLKGDHQGHTTLIRKMEEKNGLFRRHSDALKAFANLRNVIVHNPHSKEIQPIAEPHDKIVEKYDKILNTVMNPPVALNTIAIRAQKVYSTTLEANALEVMKEMNKHTYTHVPVLKDGKLVGVFSENTIFSFLVKEQILATDDTISIQEFADLIPVDKHESEYFEFVPRDTLVTDIEEMFQNGLKDQKRISVVFITETGKSSEKILGLVTAWDIAGYTNRI